MPFFHVAVDIHVREHESIGTRLRQHGIDPRDLKAVVLSYLHHDHGDGIPDLVGALMYVSQGHWDAYKHPFRATVEGAVSGHWPTGFEPEILEPYGGPLGPWTRSYPVTSDGTVVAVDTPGHVPGHLSLIVRGNNATYVLLGDATYNQELLDREMIDGVNGDPHLAVEPVRKVEEFARTEKTILLRAHDPDAANRLLHHSIYSPDYTAVLGPLPPQAQGSAILLWVFGLLILTTLVYKRQHQR